MAQLTLNINKWLCGDYDESRKDSKIGITFLGNKEGALVVQNPPESKEHSMCCLGQFLNQAGISEEMLTGNGQPSDMNHDANFQIDPETLNHEISDIFVEMTRNGEDETIHINDTPLANDLMEVNDDIHTTIFQKIRTIKQKLEEKGHTLVIEDPKGELDIIRKQYVEKELTI